MASQDCATSHGGSRIQAKLLIPRQCCFHFLSCGLPEAGLPVLGSAHRTGNDQLLPQGTTVSSHLWPCPTFGPWPRCTGAPDTKLDLSTICAMTMQPMTTRGGWRARRARGRTPTPRTRKQPLATSGRPGHIYKLLSSETGPSEKS